MICDYLVVQTVSGYAVVQHVAGPGPHMGEWSVVVKGCSRKETALEIAQWSANYFGKPGPKEQDAKDRESAAARAVQKADLQRRQAEEDAAGRLRWAQEGSTT